MSISIIQILFTLFDISSSQYQVYSSLLFYDTQFTERYDSMAYLYSGGFIRSSDSGTPQFISCAAPFTDYITLTQLNPSAKTQYTFAQTNRDWISIDLYFQGTWSSEMVNVAVGSFSYSYTYTSPTTYTMATGFCDTAPFEVKTLNFTLALSTTRQQIKFTSTNLNNGMVSLKNLHVSQLKCYPSCSSCIGPKYNQCTGCYYGVPADDICPPCPSNQYYQRNIGCRDICDIDSPFYSNGFCQSYKTYLIREAEIKNSDYKTENSNWYLIYDQQYLDLTPTIIENNYKAFGIFKFNSGIYRYISITPTFQSTYLIGLEISIIVYNHIPVNCGIQFKINNTYYGSIYRNGSGLQTNKLKISSTQDLGSYLTYSQSIGYKLILYVDIPNNTFLFSAIGNYTDSTAGWGIMKIQITSGYCPENCKLCEVSFKCKSCSGGYYFYRDGKCIWGCSFSYQKLVGSYCQDYDEETPYSEFLVKEYIDRTGDPCQYAQYSLISQSGSNFLKGSDIYFSYWYGNRVFGGPFVWAQAKFQRIHNIITPHHSVTIAFYIVYGPSFPTDGSFIYQIENNTPVSKSTTSYFKTYPDGSKEDKVYEKITHNTNTLTISWECFGPNNEPIMAYCGFYNYIIVIHNCKPYCLQCSDQSTCTLWNSTYDSSIIKFSQAECLNNQYYDKESVKCLDCPQSCLTCTSKLDCQTCQSTYTQSKLGCTCTIHQYEESNQCFDCPVECNQCLTSTQCIECLITNYRQLSNGQCKCIDGYYQIASNPQCKLCHQFCKTCIGPTSDDCVTCNNIANIEKVGSTCRCPAGKSYQDATQACMSCHSSCLTCFRLTIDGCLTCDSTLNRKLKGLKCVCAPGYYELNNSCTNCPITEDSSLSQCYKLCNNNLQLWHTITCSSCDTGFQLVSGECQPICGDGQIKGHEQCEDNNTILNDLCFNCQFQCPAHCLTCVQSTTLPCPDVCGDGIITGIEQCEDGNTIQYDGCYNCQYQCQPYCTKCIKGQCFECATVGFYIDPTVSPWQCKEKCGDFLIVGNEQCDDGNTSDTDGCKDCKYFCRIDCASCDYTSNKCLSCQLPGFVPNSYYCKNVCGDGIVVVDPYGFNTEQCDDGNTINQDGCSSSCSFQCQPTSICTSCISNRCEICATGYYLSNQKLCIPICGDFLSVVGEQCEHSFILPYKGCQNCQAKCQNSCLTCDTTGLGCLVCQPGYNRIDNLCYSNCGNKIITQDEQCDDGNLIYGDGCHFCQFSCQDSCLNCLKGICYDCQEGYQLIQSKCYSICGDGLQKYKEQCDIITSLQIYKNCQSCEFRCDFNCFQCQFGVCQQCKDGYELSLDKVYCVKSLQYNLMIIENCDIQIGNYCIKCSKYAYFEKTEQKCNLKVAPLSFCQYQLKLSPNLYCSYCFDYCATCNQNSCIDCQNGYYLDKNFTCISYCGDGILAHDEQCEIYDKNCLSCMYVAPKLCELHFKDQCFQCEYGFYFNLYRHACESQCGDGIIVQDEDCEDNNYIEFDGCYNCKYSCSQQCINCLKGICQQCDQHFLLRDGFCYGQHKQIDLFGECQFNLNGNCLVCKDEYQLNEYGDCIPKCSVSCIHCYNGKCYQCAEQFELNQNRCFLIQQCQIGFQLNYDLQICQSSCGDGYITGWEECDDQNIEKFDGCYQCKYECDDDCTQCIYVENKCLSKCQNICLNCIQGACQLCSSGYFLNEYFICIKIDCEYDFSCTSYCGNGKVEDMEQCDDQNLFNDDDCNNYCEQTCDVNCARCIEGVCLECKEGWKLDSYFCDPICGDLIVVGNEECDDGNQISFDGCFLCKYECSQNCESCLYGICQICQNDYEFDQLNNLCKPIQPLLKNYEQLNCQLLNNNQCIHCQFGYLDQITSTCIIDYNMNKCFKHCKECVLSKCLECEFGYYGNKCTPKCGDGIIVQQEECDDGREYQLDRCLNCSHQCPQYCQSCAYGICTNCFSGFYLDVVSNSCNSDCGDQILASDEVCDDGNLLEYDGCFQCKYQCQVECLDCSLGKCLQCEPPTILQESTNFCQYLKSCEDVIGLYYDKESNDCLPQCGDGIVAGNEYCDDENNFPFDGCYECKFQCTKSCQVCKDGICFECDKDYTLDNNQCVLNKESDQINSSINNEVKNNDKTSNFTSSNNTSGNNKGGNNKGSNNASSYYTSSQGQNLEISSLSENLICRENECAYSLKPNMVLIYKQQSFALQYVEITFDQQVKFRDQIEKDRNLFDLSIEDLDSQYYNITINSIQDISFDLQNASYSVQIELFLQLQTKPLLLVQLNQEVVNSNDQALYSFNQSITLQTPKIISKQIKQVTVYAQQSNKAFLIGAISICAISLVSGESSFVVETLNLLQYQSFLRYINVDYPENLNVYFQAQELLSVSSYLQYFQIDDYLNLITRKEKQIDLNGKFQQYKIEADLFTNILPQLIQFIGFVTLIYFAEKLYFILFRLSLQKEYLQQQETYFSKIKIAMINSILVFQNCIRQSIKTKYLQYYDQVIQLIYINSWDLIFKMILQLHYHEINNLRSILSTSFAGLIFFSYINLLLKLFSICNDAKEKNQIANLKIKFVALDVSRTMIFHILLILFQEQQILQCLLISISSVTQCIIIYKYKSCSHLDRILLLIIEGILTLFSLSLFLYIDIDLDYFSYEKKVTLGFIQMAFLIMSLGIVFAKQLFLKIQLALRLICKKKELIVSKSK
ncbi:unnamed protein product (macronuclear) [Paramecium tetraurelia]|uniref:EGF-like domain-containing protein n=1 Tax=Paramecium tetraurelia TaxID=5888 RepID=A0DUJ5_PARTE|nr:uncharacterized protein GSPATT00020384001 [Paramecium tetraurelia]CAK86712.1 unnamed protein product [Paramecium tetraurelia]|eukprot:XP_001454109.1 hypothetical protein (macronuclear) [Paramecium tetraurelia strain d4-2]